MLLGSEEQHQRGAELGVLGPPELNREAEAEGAQEQMRESDLLWPLCKDVFTTVGM